MIDPIDLDMVSTQRGVRYRAMGYWFATGWWFAQPRDAWVPDRSSEFGNYCGRRADEYDSELVTHLPSIPDMWKEFTDEPAPPDDD